MQIYFIRHQAGGVMWEFPFADEPTQAQLVAVTAICDSRYKAAHPKTGEPHWSKVIAVDVLDRGDIPALPEPPGDGDGVTRIGLPAPSLSGRAHIENPK